MAKAKETKVKIVQIVAARMGLHIITAPEAVEGQPTPEPVTTEVVAIGLGEDGSINALTVADFEGNVSA